MVIIGVVVILVVLQVLVIVILVVVVVVIVMGPWNKAGLTSLADTAGLLDIVVLCAGVAATSPGLAAVWLVAPPLVMQVGHLLDHYSSRVYCTHNDHQRPVPVRRTVRAWRLDPLTKAFAFHKMQRHIRTSGGRAGDKILRKPSPCGEPDGRSGLES